MFQANKSFNFVIYIKHLQIVKKTCYENALKGINYMYVSVRDNNVDQALRILKKKMQREGVFREMKNRRVYEKPSEKKARELAESTRRVRKLMRKRLEREGY